MRHEAYDANQKLLELVRNYADEKNATPAQIPLAWMMSKKPYIVPIPGSRKPERDQHNDSVLTITEILHIIRAETEVYAHGSNNKFEYPYG